VDTMGLFLSTGILRPPGSDSWPRRPHIA